MTDEKTSEDPDGGRLNQVTLPARPRPGSVSVHPAAHVERGAVLEDGVQIGPGAYVGPEVHLGRGVRVGPHAVLTGKLHVGPEARIFAGAVIGEEPQDLKYRGERSSTRIGARTCVREHATVHRGSQEGGETVVGDDVLLMASSHVAHDCRVGDRVVLCNGALLAGHVEVHPQAFVSGNAVVHQFARIGRLAMIGGGSRVARDVPTFGLLVGDSQLRGVNGVGLRRSGMSREAQEEIRTAYRLCLRGGAPLRDVLPKLAETLRTPEALELLAFLGSSKRGICAMDLAGDGGGETA